MMEYDIFQDSWVDLFCPNSNELLLDFVYLLGYKDNDLQNPKTKEHTLGVIKILLELDVIKIFKWVENIELNQKELTTKQTLKHLDDIWFDGAIYPDFYRMVLFGSTYWYLEKLESLGMTNTTNWKWFVKNKIGDLKKWIDDNRPKTKMDDD